MATNFNPLVPAVNFASETNSEMIEMLSLKYFGSAKTNFISTPSGIAQQEILYKVYCCEVDSFISQHTYLGFPPLLLHPALSSLPVPRSRQNLSYAWLLLQNENPS